MKLSTKLLHTSALFLILFIVAMLAAICSNEHYLYWASGVFGGLMCGFFVVGGLVETWCE